MQASFLHKSGGDSMDRRKKRRLAQLLAARLSYPYLPDGWTQVSYIESSGTQYIDLGYKGGENTKAELDFCFPAASSSSGSGRLFGSRTSAVSNAFAFGTASGTIAATGNQLFWCYDAQPFYTVSDITVDVNEWHNIIFSATEHRIDGVTYGTDYTPTSFDTPSNLAVFGFDNNGSFGYGRIRVSSCKLWNGSTLLRDLIPVYDGTEYAMYDYITDTILHNAGSGVFTGA